MNKFSEIYQTLSTPDLLKILEFEEDYQPDAIDAARAELKSRDLSEEELAVSKKEIEDFVEAKVAGKQEPNVVVRISKSIWQEIKITSDSPNHEKIIFIFAVLYLAYAAYSLQYYVNDFKIFAEEGNLRYKFFLAFDFWIDLVPLFAALTLIFRQNIGWILAYSFAIHMGLYYLLNLFSGIMYKDELFYFEEETGYLFYMLRIFFWLSAFVAASIFLLQPSVRERLKVNATLIAYSTVLTVVFSVLLIFMFLKF